MDDKNDEDKKAKKSRIEHLRGLHERGQLTIKTTCSLCGSQAIMYKGKIICGFCLRESKPE